MVLENKFGLFIKANLNEYPSINEGDILYFGKNPYRVESIIITADNHKAIFLSKPKVQNTKTV